MSAVDELMSQLPLDDIAAQLGIDRAQAESAVQHALPALLYGVAANAEDHQAAESLGEALTQHDPLDGAVDVSGIDVGDGEKIVGHVFGGNTDQVVSQLANAPQAAGLGAGLTKKLLSILAPIVLSYLERRRSRGPPGRPARRRPQVGPIRATARSEPGA